MKKAVESTGRKQSRMLHAADAKRVSEMWKDSEEARRNWDTVTDWEDAKKKMEECEKGYMLLAKNRKRLGNINQHACSIFPK